MHFRVGLNWPTVHIHLAIQRPCHRKAFSSELPATTIQEELTESEMAVSDEWTHAELYSQREGSAVMAFCSLAIGGIVAAGKDGTEDVESPRLMTALLMLLGQRHGLLRALPSVVEAAFEQARFAEPRELHGMPHAHRAHRGRRARHFLEKIPGFARTPG